MALAVADIDAGTVRTVSNWAVIGAGTMPVLALLTLFRSSGGEMPALATVRYRAYLSNFLIGGSVGATLTGLYASRNRQQRIELQQQTNRLEVLNRLLRHEVLNAQTVIRGNATRATVRLLTHTALLEFLTTHGINPVVPSSYGAIGVVTSYEEDIVSTEPFEAMLTFTANGDTLTFTVADDFSVMDVTHADTAAS